MAWIQDGGSNPWYANFNNTALDFITFNGVQVWASSYSFSITVSYKVGAIGFEVVTSSPSECESEYTNNTLSYVSRFSVSVSNVVGCDKILFTPMGASGRLDKLKFTYTGITLEAQWSDHNAFYNVETDSGYEPSFFIDRFYLASGTPAQEAVGYYVYNNGTYSTVSSLQSDPSVDSSTKPNGAVNNPNRALKYYHSIDLPDSYYYERQVDTARSHRWYLSSNGCIVPLEIRRGTLHKFLHVDVDINAEARSDWSYFRDFDVQRATRTITPSQTDSTSGAWS